ncbi:ABC transporter ATP-binding protein [Nodularia spumigena CS-584]|jgi:ABC-2 type transport system ATP-binding protein|uniref:Daunorubicin/doxorubicin resistance ATP-binding protein DrrA n=2 Tax=Nodularia spumigena TaxID=70799 RepID=A0A2S0PZU3_NODSP|nr:ABC transporter ATP-binding protein [Nodularia spumigena]MDB9357153.1 ABC transporter ATP-binding protein [Nodularia spumigena CS-587/03]AHJ27545.1 Methionine ABC transporter ATP-binding protein [Nodularia spumigena CCY9414]AVZ30026.1 daunorubicin/doxorubicin resistance ATP-binding protein DrrA [Nodularia spumigena UHCC 0039]EAW46568.1 ABC transporter (ATP-binding protein) [Nodularia spumigena CCY9414]MDB9306905.1 ABC transporter ATP-binding protein [Nodularia spumigena CS-591/12]
MLKITHLNKSYGSVKVLQDLNLQIESGEVYGLLGANGSGKTTTINIICNLLKADSGDVIINEQRVSEATKKIIGIAPQENLLYKTLSCEENLNFFANIYGLSRELRQKQVQETLASVNLLDRAKSPVETLSGGMQRRLNIAVALVHQPQLVILDEPTTGLDIEARYQIWELIRELKNQGVTVLLTTHLLDEAERLCDKIGILKNGHILAEGSLAQLRKLIPASEVLVVKTAEKEQAIARGKEYNFTHKSYGNELAFWLPEPLELKEILARFEGIELDSISRLPVGLEHIYLEVTQG